MRKMPAPNSDSSKRGIIGAVIAGRYRIRRKIASGGIATVYEGLVAELGKRVAIKLIDERFVDEAEVVERFRLEARAASAIESEHIVQVFDIGEDPTFGLFMVMEFLHGEDLGKRLARVGRVDVDVAAAIGQQASWALAKAHELGIVHRDLKPENLFLIERSAPGTFVKLLDFGIAKLTRELGLGMAGLTARGTTLGTPQYMSPEQIQAAPDIDHGTDIWSLGAVLFEALAGRPAFAPQPTFVETLLQICTELPPRLADVAPWVPADLASIVDSALEPDRSKRLPDARTFARRLLDVAHGPLTVAFAPSSLVLAARAVQMLPLSISTPIQPLAPMSSDSAMSISVATTTAHAAAFYPFDYGERDDTREPMLLGPAGTTVSVDFTAVRTTDARNAERSSNAEPWRASSSSKPPHQSFSRSLPPSSIRPSSPSPLRPSYAPRRSTPPRRRVRKAPIALTVAGTLLALLALSDLALRVLAPNAVAVDRLSAAMPRERDIHFARVPASRPRVLLGADAFDEDESGHGSSEATTKPTSEVRNR
jgi:serine/threonine protein kinase